MPANLLSLRPFRRRFHLPATFRSLRHYNFRLWFFGQTVSLIGTWMQAMAQQVLVYRLTGSAAALGMVNFIALIPVVPLSLWGGSIADRFPKRTIIILAQVAMMLQAFILAWLTWTGTVQLWHVYVLALFLGAASAIDLPARQAFVVDMVEGKDDLANAIGLNSAMFNMARAAGPAMAGVLVAATGEGPAFFMNGLTFLAVMISLMFMRNLPPPSIQRGVKIKTLKHMAEGLSYVRTRQVLIALISLIAISAFLSMPYSTLLPVFATDILGDSAKPVIDAICGGDTPLINCQAPEALPLGILFAMVGVGAVCGALFVASRQGQTGSGKLLTVGNLLFPSLLLLFAFSKSFIFSLGIMLLIGFSFVLQNALANTLLQMTTPDELRGRVMSIYTLTFQIMMRMGSLQAGFVAEWSGAPFSVAIGAIISLAYGIFVFIRYPKVRRL
ncbi:MAG TPA: MFS transporter [Anaerolineales bacterium]|nr:MFS transporter [Anaerolineales bacterium]